MAESKARKHEMSQAIFIFISTIISSPSDAASQNKYLLENHDVGCNLVPESFSDPARPGDNGFSLKLEGMPEFYDAERSYTVSLQSTFPVTFRGFGLHAIHNESFSPAGSFQILNPWLTKAKETCSNVVTHTSYGKKSQVKFVWTAPSPNFGCVRIRASVVQKGTIWYLDDGELSFTICEMQKANTSNSDRHCCACGSAQYRLTFFGLWSPISHPKDYPTYSTHWSNIIGASHDSQYILWDYGEYASDGLQKVAEWGWPNALENEIKGQGSRILSIIKTRAQWPAYNPQNIGEPPTSIFYVDYNHHLVSFVTMMGPSPDWSVGITKHSMCTSDCDWKSTESIDLTPWDAGTDSGVSYLSPNSRTSPPDRIRALTTLDNPSSPFYNSNGGPIPAVARVVMERISLSLDQCRQSLEVAQMHDIHENINQSRSTESLLCMYEAWSNWTQCDESCGWGIRTRIKLRDFKYIDAASVSCEQNITEREICKETSGCTNLSSYGTACLYSDWMAWSECTSSCGNGSFRFRMRKLMWPSEPYNCHGSLKETAFDCIVPPCNDLLCHYGDWSDWMPCSSQCGVGMTSRKRLALHGAGCVSPQIERSQCMTSLDCSEAVATTSLLGCVYSSWSAWMLCPVSCGIGTTFRKRVLTTPSPRFHCEEIQMEHSKCMKSKSCTERNIADIEYSSGCLYTNWSGWTLCSSSCFIGQTFRKRFLKDGCCYNESCEEIHMEAADCYMPPCSLFKGIRSGTTIQQKRVCMYSKWTIWMPCSVTCGRGRTRRQRFLIKSLDKGNMCEGYQVETNQCSVTAQCDEIENPIATVNCEFTEWSNWSICSPCRHRTPQSRSIKISTMQKRTRRLIRKQAHGDGTCLQNRKQKRLCVCPI